MNRIKLLRLENNMSQRDLASLAKCSQKSVDYWEKGVSEPTAGFVCTLADIFSCTTDYLLGREDDFGIVRIEGGLGKEERKLLSLYAGLSEPQKQDLLSYAGYLLSKK